MDDFTSLESCVQDGVTMLREPDKNIVQLQGLSADAQAYSSFGFVPHAAALHAAAPQPLLYEELYGALLPDDILAAATRGDLNFTPKQCNAILAVLAVTAVPEDAVPISAASTAATPLALGDTLSYTSLARRKQAVAENPSYWVSHIKDKGIDLMVEILFRQTLKNIELKNARTWEHAKKNAIHISFPICKDNIEERNKRMKEASAGVQAAFEKLQCNAAVFLIQGTATVSKVIRGVSQSRYSHAALVVRVDDKLRIWQAAGSNGKSGADFPGHMVEDGFEAESGPALHSLELFLHDYYNHSPKGKMVVRPLRIPIGETPQSFIQHMDQLRKDKVQFPSGGLEMAWMWVMAQDLPIIRTISALIKRLHKIFGELDPKDEKVKKMFCAGAVADAYINLGLMSNKRDIASYAPHAFGAQLDHATEIKLKDEWLFGDESFVDFKKSK